MGKFWPWIIIVGVLPLLQTIIYYLEVRTLPLDQPGHLTRMTFKQYIVCVILGVLTLFYVRAINKKVAQKLDRNHNP
jgi:hypothetical protein